jgi:hypothetical protein
LEQNPPAETADQPDDPNDRIIEDHLNQPNEGAAADTAKTLPLTVGQFLKRSPQRQEIDGLIRSLYSSNIMTLEKWNHEIDTLLKKKIS